MNVKTTLILVVALLLAVGGVWWAESSSEPAEPEQPPGPQSLFDLSEDDIVGFEITSASGAACTFEKKDGTWQMIAPISGPAETGYVSGDVRKIAGLTYVETFKKGDPDAPTDEMTALARPRRTVKLTDKQGNHFTVRVGARQQLSSKTYVQKEGDETIYLVEADLNKDLDRNLNDYRGKQITRFKTAEATRVEVKGERNYTLVKQNGRWTIDAPIKARAQISAVNTLLNSLANMRVSDWVEDAPKNLRPYLLDAPRLVVTVTTEKKTPKPVEGPPASQPAEVEYDVTTSTLRVAFGGAAEEKVFARLDAPASPAVFQIPEATFKTLAPALKELRDPKVANLVPGRAQRLKVTVGADSVEMAKDGAIWKTVGGAQPGTPAVAELAAVLDLLNAIRDLKAVGFEDAERPAFGFEQPRAEIEVTVEGQVRPLRLLVGGTSPSKTGAYIKNVDENLIAVVPASKAEALLVRPIAFRTREILQFSSAQATRVRLARASGACTVERTGATWRFASPVEGTAEVSAVNNILSDLSRLRGRRAVARGDEAAAYGLDHPDVTVTVTVAPPPEPVASQPATSQSATTRPEPKAEPRPPVDHQLLVARRGGKVYAMKPGGATVFEVDAKILDDLQAELLDTRVLPGLQPSQVRLLGIRGETAFEFEKTGDEWTLRDEATFQADPTKITAALDALRDLRADRYVRYLGGSGAEFGLEQPQIEVAAETDDGRRLTLAISARGPKTGGRYARVSSAADRVFVIKPETVEKFRKKVTDFQKAS